MTRATAIPAGATLLGTVRPYRSRVAFTYGLTLAENLFELLYPFAVGLAIDGLLAGRGWPSLMPFAAVWLAHIATGAFRQRYDTRLFTRIYGDVAGAMVERQRAAGISTGEVAARAVMAREVVDFFEIEVPAMTAAAIQTFGGIGMLFVYDALAGAIMAALLVPVAGLHLLYGRRALALSVRLNDRHEREVDAVADGRRGRVRAHFRALARWRVMLSDAQVAAWSAAELLALGAVLLVLLRLTDEPGVRTGDIVAAFAYVFAVLDGLDEAPVIVQQLARLVDIRRRVAQGGRRAAPIASRRRPARPSTHPEEPA